MPIRTSEKVSVEGNSWQVEYSPPWRSRVNLEKVTRCFHAGLLEDRPIPSWISDWLLKKVKRDCLWSSHLTPDKVNADQDIREGQNISKKSHGAFMLDLCRIFHYAWFRWHDSAWFRPFQKVTSHGFHHDLRPGGRLPRKCITECFRAGPAWKIQKQQPQVSSWHGTDGVWFQCRPQIWETTARLCFWDKFAFSINKTQETGVKICVHSRWIVDDKQKRSRWKCRSIHERSRKSS